MVISRMITAPPFELKFTLSYKTLLRIPLSVPVETWSLAQGLAPPATGHQRRAPGSKGCIWRCVPQPHAGRVTGDDQLVYVMRRYPRYYADLSGGFEAYQARLSASARATLRRKLRKFSEASDGIVDFRVYRTLPEMKSFFALARDVSAESYQEKVMNAGLPAYDSIAHDIEKLAAVDAVRGFLLFYQGKPISYLYCPADGDVLLYAKLGYHPNHGHLSAGNVLQWLAFESLTAEGRFRYFDFTEGDGQHKAAFATGRLECADILILPRTFSNRCLIAFHKGFHSAIERVADWSEKFGLRHKVRRFLRRN